MNPWTVIWQRSAEESLADIWNHVVDKSQVTQAAHTIDAALKSNPFHFGEARSGLLRMAFVPPLCVIFEVIPDDFKVIVEMVRLY